MQKEQPINLGVCPVCEEVVEINGEPAICETCLRRLDRWLPGDAEREPLPAVT